MNNTIDHDADLRAYDTEDLPDPTTFEPECCVFDIETRPLDFDQIKHLMPEFSAPANYKDEEKIAANIAEQRAKWIEKAALSPVTGAVCAIGGLRDGVFAAYVDPEGNCEKEILEWFWRNIGRGTQLIGFNNHRFDLPFLMRRSWLHGITVPKGLMRGRYFQNSTDLMELWNCGGNDFVSLNTVARFLGVGSKNGSGEFFHELLKTDPKAAGAYLENDIMLTAGVAVKMGAMDRKWLPNLARESWIGGGE